MINALKKPTQRLNDNFPVPPLTNKECDLILKLQDCGKNPLEINMLVNSLREKGGD